MPDSIKLELQSIEDEFKNYPPRRPWFRNETFYSCPHCNNQIMSEASDEVGDAFDCPTCNTFLVIKENGKLGEG